MPAKLLANSVIVRVMILDSKSIKVCVKSDRSSHRALLALASWNSYVYKRPLGPIVLATECEKDPDPVPERG